MKVSVEKALLYNFRDPEREKKLKSALLCMGVGIKTVAEEDFCRPLGDLIGMPVTPSEENPPKEQSSFDEEMLVLHRFSDKRLNELLRRLQKAGLFIPHKAVLTPTNMAWSGARLMEELRLEHEAVQNGRSVHGGSGETE